LGWAWLARHPAEVHPSGRSGVISDA